MQSSLLKILGVVGLIALLVCFILAALGMIGAVNIGNGCFMRYGTDGKSGVDTISDTATLNANANYTNITTTLPNGTIQVTSDPAHYGEWLNTNILAENKQVIQLQIIGELSLCLAYVPKDNLQFTEATRPGKSNLDDKGNLIPIPRTTDVDTLPLSLIIDAKNNEWRNIAELYNNDRILVSVTPGSANNLINIFTGKPTTDSNACAQGQTTYSPICGRYSVYSGQYVSACELKQNYWQCNKHMSRCSCVFNACGKFICSNESWDPDCCPHAKCNSCPAWVNVTPLSTAPESYKDDGSFTFAWSDDTSKLFIDYSGLQCSNNANIPPNGQCPDVVSDRSPKDKVYIGGSDSVCPSGICNQGAFQNERYFWYTVDGNGGNGPTGLIWQLNNAGTVDANIGTPQFATFVADSDQPAEYKDSNGKAIYKVIYNQAFNPNASISYLQYRLWTPSGQDASKNTGGYVLNIKQTKCYRKNGNSFSDVFADRGKVQYIIVPPAENPNSKDSNGNPVKSYSALGIDVDSEGKAQVTAASEGYVWMKILNNQSDYQDSEGSYTVKFFTYQKVGSFTVKVMTPLLTLFKTKVQNAAERIFQNMICYGGDTASCTNFFNYIKALLILYVMLYGAMYLLGLVKINQQELVIRIVKITIVSGLINGSTFEFFNKYLFDAITGFSDEIISNMSGYSLFTSTNTISNPFMFLDAVMSKIFFSQTFIAQLLALLSLGLSGLIYFVIVFIAIMIVIITALRAVAVYIMAFMATCILIGIGPLFLTFMLFDFTRYLFDNWVRFTFRYMLEPVIMMAGIIVLTQLFTIYLDFVLGYSVCWKCTIPIKIPFIGTMLPVAFLNIPIFCINWFAPWGMDYNSGMMGVNMQNIIALVIIAYGMYGYIEFSSTMVAKLTSGAGGAGPSATSMGGAMSNAAETGALKQVGMDKESRARIGQAADQRLATRNDALKKGNKSQFEESKGKKPENNNEGK